MRKLLVLAALLMIFGASQAIENEIYKEKMIVVLTASYNNKDWYERNLMSIFSQKYFNYHVLYIDDCSTDGTPDLVEKWTKAHDVSDRITIIRNKKNLGGLHNHYRAMQLIPDRAIVCVVDGDDWLSRDTVFAFLNETYHKNDIWMSYGQFQAWPSGMLGWCCEIPESYVSRNAYREYPHNLSHLRTFYAGLFKQIKKEDLMCGKEFWTINDNAAMFPMAEMARGHVKFLPQVLLMWNDANPLNDHKERALGRQRQLDADRSIRSLSRYEKVESPFKDNVESTIAVLKSRIQQACQNGMI